MDNLKPLKSFLSDLITPIVKTAVGEAIPEAIKDKEKNLVPVQKISLPIIPLRSFLEKSPKEQNLVRAARAIKDSKKKQLLIHKKLPAIVIPIKVWSRDFSLPYSKLVKEYNALILLEVPELRNAKVSTWLMNNSTTAEKEEGLDIGDWLIRLPSIRTLRLEDYL